MKTKHILTGSIALLTLALPAFAGSPEKKTDTKPADDALTFADGLLTLDILDRLRFEERKNNGSFNNNAADPSNGGVVLNQLRVGLAIKPADWIKIYGQTQDLRQWYGKRGNVPGVSGAQGDDSFDIRQAYVELGNLKEFPLTLTVGRQVLTYGDSRLVADRGWNDLGRTFDGVKLRFQNDKFWVDAFAVRPVQIRKESINDSDSADNFFGLYGGTDILGFQTTELYVLYRDKSDAQPDLSPTNKTNPSGAYDGNAQRNVTIGTRWKSKDGALHGFDYTTEFAYQFGDLWTGARTTPRLSQHGFALAFKGGYTWENVPWTPRFGIGYDYASGDKNPKDGSSQTFQNLFPSNHENTGYMDEFAWSNLHCVRASLSANPIKSLKLSADFRAFWLAETTDYWYTSTGNGNTLRTTTPSTTVTTVTTKKGVTTTKTTTQAGKDVRTLNASNFAGTEIDLSAKWTVNKHLSFLVGYSHFFAGSYLKQTGGGIANDGDFAYAQVTLKF